MSSSKSVIAYSFQVGLAFAVALLADTTWLHAQEPVAAAGWNVKLEPPAEIFKWPDSQKISIPLKHEDILMPSIPSPFCLINIQAYESSEAELWNLATGKRAGAIKGEPAKATKRAISPDGKYLACHLLDNNKRSQIEVWALQGGKRLCLFEADENNGGPTHLEFAGPDELVTFTLSQTAAGQFAKRVRVSDAKTGRSLRSFEIKNNIYGQHHGLITPGGKYFMAPDTNSFEFFDLATGEPCGRLVPSKKTESGVYVSPESIVVSPDCTEAAIYSDGQKTGQIEVFDLATGDLKLTHELRPASFSYLQNESSYKGPPLEFVEEPAGFLWYGTALIDRETGDLLWRFCQHILEYSHTKRILTPKWLMMVHGGYGKKKLESLRFPGSELTKTFAAYSADGPAIVKPGSQVKLDIVVGKVLQGSADDTRSAIEDVMTERLADDGIEVSDEGSTTFTVVYAEEPGRDLEEVVGADIFGNGGKKTGRVVKGTISHVSLNWRVGEAKPFFEDSYDYEPSSVTIFNKEGSIQAEARKQIFDIFKRNLLMTSLPYYVPEDPSIGSLPMTTYSPLAKGESKADKIKKKLDAKKKPGSKGK